MGDARRGTVLVLCVLLMLGLGLLAHGALLMAGEELRVSRAGARQLRARAAAEAALNDAVAGRTPVLPDSAPPGESTEWVAGNVGTARYRLGARRLTRELWLLVGEGAAEPGVWIAREGRPVWSLDPVARVGAFRGTVEVGPGAPVEGVAGVSGADAFTSVADPDDGACRGWALTLDSLARARPGGLPPVALTDTAGLAQPSLGLLAADALGRVATLRVSGEGRPQPTATVDGCVTTVSWNWGDPEDPLGRCHDDLPLVDAPGALVVDGGVGQGVLVVGGDLTLTGGATYFGLVLVGGRLTLDAGARLVGLAKAAGGLRVMGGARVTGEACPALRALAAARPLLGHPILLPGVGRVGPL